MVITLQVRWSRHGISAWQPCEWGRWASSSVSQSTHMVPQEAPQKSHPIPHLYLRWVPIRENMAWLTASFNQTEQMVHYVSLCVKLPGFAKLLKCKCLCVCVCRWSSLSFTGRILLMTRMEESSDGSWQKGKGTASPMKELLLKVHIFFSTFPQHVELNPVGGATVEYMTNYVHCRHNSKPKQKGPLQALWMLFHTEALKWRLSFYYPTPTHTLLYSHCFSPRLFSPTSTSLHLFPLSSPLSLSLSFHPSVFSLSHHWG